MTFSRVAIEVEAKHLGSCITRSVIKAQIKTNWVHHERRMLGIRNDVWGRWLADNPCQLLSAYQGMPWGALSVFPNRKICDVRKSFYQNCATPFVWMDVQLILKIRNEPSVNSFDRFWKLSIKNDRENHQVLNVMTILNQNFDRCVANLPKDSTIVSNWNTAMNFNILKVPVSNDMRRTSSLSQVQKTFLSAFWLLLIWGHQ